MYGIYTLVIKTPPGDLENYVEVKPDGATVVSKLGEADAYDYVINGKDIAFSLNLGPSIWAFKFTLDGGKLTGKASNNEVPEVAALSGEKLSIDLDAARAEIAKQPKMSMPGGAPEGFKMPEGGFPGGGFPGGGFPGGGFPGGGMPPMPQK